MVPFPIVIFDFDGTLCATEEAILYTFQKLFEEKALPPPTPETIKQAVGTGGNISELLPQLHPPLQGSQNEGELRDWGLHYRRLYDTEGGQLTTLFPGAEDLLAQLKVQQVTCVVISNKGQRAIEDALDRFNLRQHFALVLGDNPEHPLQKKPHPMAYEQVIQPRYPEVPASRVLMVGDTDADLQFANNAGLVSCWAAYGYGAEAACLAAEPRFTIHSLADLYPILTKEA
ncbi:HAD family hydrolase [Rufibacter glacialis]|uniref:phosphoglycolate phosphatase n=1 Tax=Rufibacter glacialis TaxID=1259555 RepID=A0A5M8QMP5_9BACT|nr:HAD family hydrolase [Rufibacter glacialis]KAA6435873.1 HAD family hydrolase [Rufibacter glacialis]GGK67308.1 hydrolase [Rufibacter glacialis]